ncbi:unnamed protein product [Eruca vesicaria subsp. sativa]|uniref:Uncharacterized protein n=1 Tax=Eruca vesicaria subsp. sativa TaxID=29727 RepID=A0ABC8JTU9_ERUVS|nr:unnamed protein product [Eruca vesicaria subsp. sativa]
MMYVCLIQILAELLRIYPLRTSQDAKVDKAEKLNGGRSSKSGGSLAEGTLGLEWRRSKLWCVTGRWRQRWSSHGVGRGVVQS